MQAKDVNESVGLLAGVVMFMIALAWNYHSLAHGYFDHLGIQYFAPGAFELFLIVGAAMIVSFLARARVTTPSDLVIHVLIIVLLLPTLSVRVIVSLITEPIWAPASAAILK